MKKKNIWKWLLGAVMAIVVALTCVSGYFINYSLYNGKRVYDEKAQWDSLKSEYPRLSLWIDSVRQDNVHHEEWMANADGDSIRIYYIPAQHPTTKTAVLAHGYKMYAIDMMHIGYMYHHALGYNVLTYDQHAHGRSEGKMIQMGWKDRLNLIEAVKKAHKLFGDSIVMHGISMGGATTMMASGDETLPKYVFAAVDDCGYTSVWDEFSGELGKQFSLPPFPILHWTNMVSKLALGWSFKEASSLKMVEKCRVPMLFIHGGNDTYVPTKMVYTLYKAHPGKKQLWIAPGSPHAMSYRDHPEEYTEKVRSFLKP